MQPLSASDLLTIWERGTGRSPAEQSLLLLALASPDCEASWKGPDPATQTVGQRDACLLRLRERTFGSQLSGLADCPQCHAPLELSFSVSDLLAAERPERGQIPGDLAQRSEDALNPPNVLHTNGYELTFRLPASTDLLGAPDPTRLLENCLLSAHHAGRAVPVSELPADIIATLTDRMAALDPLANLSLALTCPACAHHWSIIFDIVSYFWSEIEAWSLRLMREVHTLAMAYGWRETDILAMSAWRRQRYLEMIES